MSRKEIMDRIDKWLAACEEESWLEEYNQVSIFTHTRTHTHLCFCTHIYMHVYTHIMKFVGIWEGCGCPIDTVPLSPSCGDLVLCL